MRIRIAIDPGASGGFAWRDTAGVIHAEKMPETEGDVIMLLERILKEAPQDAIAHVEVVGGFIKGNPVPGSTMFNFGRGYGFLLGALAAWGVPVHSIRPHIWQKPLGIGTKGELSTSDWKNKLKAKAQQLYPTHGVTLKTADALLILDYAIKMNP